MKLLIAFITNLLFLAIGYAQPTEFIHLKSENFNSIEEGAKSCYDLVGNAELVLKLNNINYKLIESCDSTNFERTMWNATLSLDVSNYTSKEFLISFGSAKNCISALNSVMNSQNTATSVALQTKNCTSKYVAVGSIVYEASFVVIKKK